MQYSTRAVEIVDILIKQSDYMTVDKISEALKISKRTIFREMEIVESLLSEVGIEISKKTRLGVKVSATPSQLEALRRLTATQVDMVYSQEQRLNVLKMELLKTREPRKLFFFADQLKVSEATVSNDMDRLEEWFSDKQLKLVRKPGFGVYVEGSEKSFRKAIVDFLYQNYGHEDLAQFLSAELKSFRTDEASDQMLGLIDKDILIKVSLILKEFEDMLAHRLTENAYMGLMIHLSIAISRIQRGEGIFMNNGMLSSVKTDEQYQVAKLIAAQIEKVFEISVPEDEVGYVTMHLKGSKLKTSEMVEHHDFIISNFELSRTTAKMIQRFKELSGYDFKDDEKLLIGLATHLRPALTRMKMGLDIRNPLLEKIQEMYPEIYAMTQQVSDYIQQRYDVTVPPQEVGFLAMHFGAAIERFRKSQQVEKSVRVGVVCSSGIGTSSLLASRISKLVSKVELVGQFSKEDVIMGQLKQHNIDCLISTIPLETADYPCIVVSPLLNEQDTERIKQVVSVLGQSIKPYHDPVSIDSAQTADRLKRISELSTGILELVSGFEAIDLPKVPSTELLIDFIAGHFTAKETSMRALAKQLMERESLGATILRAEGVKLIHAKSAEVENLTLAVIRFAEPLEVKVSSGDGLKSLDLIDLCVIMLLPEAASKHKMSIMSYMSKSLIEDSKFVMELKTHDEAAMKDALSVRLHQWFELQMT